MPADLTEKEFSKHVNTSFRVTPGAEVEVDLELVEVKSYSSNPGDQDGMERFSLFFKGPAQPFLPQGLYSLRNERMGEIDIFLVPMKPEGEGSCYEAVFNYFKNP